MLDYLGTDLKVVKEAYLAYRDKAETYSQPTFFHEPIDFFFREDGVSVEQDGQVLMSGTNKDFVTLLASIDMVYAPILPLGTVVTLDTDMFPEFLQELFSEEPGATVILTGRKLDLRDGFGHYVLDYTARL